MPVFSNVKELVKRALKRIFKKKVPDIDPDLWQVAFQALDHAVGTAAIEYNKPNYAFTQLLRQSAAQFSARKSYAQSKALAELAASKPGHRITWKEFLEKARPIVKDYNETWLKTEYNMAMRKARQGIQWDRYNEEIDIYPNLKYLPSRAATPREEHKPYYGTILPVTHDFWVHHTPPISWNCLCGIKQTTEPVTAVPEKGPKPAPGLGNNPFKSGMLFADDHPYNKAIESNQTQEQVTRKAWQLLAESDNYYQIITPGANKIKAHPAYSSQDIRENLDVALLLADKGYQVELPRHTVQEGIPNPDFKINNAIADLKEPASNPKQLPSDKNRYRSISNMIRSASKQGAEIVVFSFQRSLMQFSTDDIRRGVTLGLFEGDRPINRNVNRVIFIDRLGNITETTREKVKNRNLENLSLIKAER